MRDRDDAFNQGDKPEDLLQDYLDGLLGLEQSPRQRDSAVLTNTQTGTLRYEQLPPVDRVVGDHADAPPVRTSATPNNVLPLPRFAEVRPLALKMPLPKLKPVAPAAEIAPVAVPVELPVVTPVEIATESIPEAEIAVDVDSADQAVIEPVDVVTELDETAIEQPPVFHPREWLANGRPDWAQGRFECLMFNVAGLTLAVPLVELGAISPMTDELTPLFGQIDWFMGLLPIRTGGKLRTVDTARIVMPERYHNGLRDNYRFVISIAGMDWGLAVDDVSTAISLAPEDVKWRSQRSKRPWLAGTLISQMCAVIDIQQLAYLLVQAEQR